MNKLTFLQSRRRDICRVETSSSLKRALNPIECRRCDSCWLQTTAAGIKWANVTSGRWNKRVDVNPDFLNGEQLTACGGWHIVLTDNAAKLMSLKRENRWIFSACAALCTFPSLLAPNPLGQQGSFSRLTGTECIVNFTAGTSIGQERTADGKSCLPSR